MGMTGEGPTVRERALEWHRENPDGTRHQCAEAIGAAYSSVCKAVRGTRWAAESRPPGRAGAAAVSQWHSENPDGTREECAAALGVTYRCVCCAAKGLDWRRKERERAKRGALDAAVRDWHARNPDGTRAECADAIGVAYERVCESARRLMLDWPQARRGRRRSKGR